MSSVEYTRVWSKYLNSNLPEGKCKITTSNQFNRLMSTEVTVSGVYSVVLQVIKYQLLTKCVVQCFIPVAAPEVLTRY